MLARYRLYRKRNKAPEMVVIGLDYFSLTKNSGTNMYQFYPWFHHCDFRELVFPARHFSFPERFLPLYRYKSVWMDYFHHDDNESLDKGFLGIDKSFQGDMLDNSSLSFHVNPVVEKDFSSLLDLISLDDAKIVLIQTPMYKSALLKRQNPVEMKQYYECVSNQRGIPLLDYECTYLSSDSTFFVNAQHLNRHGARLFTDSLAKDLKRFL